MFKDGIHSIKYTRAIDTELYIDREIDVLEVVTLLFIINYYYYY